ncbi:unannotated protein [freshwater metagenome]|uniref:Unannotated protein n=1 Tax=freshwater metagenome TaxID=449393 RepID=A0A6J7DGN6_9ZZZZ
MDVRDSEEQRAPVAPGVQHRDEGTSEFLTCPNGIETVEGRGLSDEVEERVADPHDLRIVVGATEQFRRALHARAPDALRLHVTETERIAERRCDRPPHVCLAVRNARPDEHGKPVGLASGSHNLLRQTALADATLTVNRHEQRLLACHRIRNTGEQQLRLLGTADHWGGALPAAAPGPQAHLLREPRVDRLLAPAWGEGLEPRVADGTVREHLGGLADEHSTGWRLGLQPGCGVHHVAHRRVGTARAEGADEHLPGIDADAHLQTGDRLTVVIAQRLLHLQRGADGPLGIVVVRDRRTEERNDAVADDLVHVPAEKDHVLHHLLEDAVHESLHLLRVCVLGQCGEPDDVRE